MMRKAWVVTWESMGDRKAPTPSLIAVFSAKTGVERVRQFAEQLYGSLTYTDGEKLTFELERGSNPYTARQNRIGPMALDQIHCGHNPFVCARKVANPRVNRRGKLEWDEIPPPVVPKAAIREFERLMGREPEK